MATATIAEPQVAKAAARRKSRERWIRQGKEQVGSRILLIVLCGYFLLPFYWMFVLATHTPEGQLLDGRRMAALALHEFGHAMGLGHSPSREDALFPVTHASDLSDRDRRTARLLYELPAGSIR